MADPIKQFVIKPIIPFEVAGIDLSFTNSALWMTLGVIVSASFFSLAVRKQAMIPGRLQAFAEMFYEFTADMLREQTGSAGKQYFPFIFTLFITIIMGNVLGLIPYSFTFTSHIIVTLALAMMVFFMVTIYGFVKNGWHFLSLFAPPGLPKPMLIVIVPLEIISFTVRPITLAVRLFANMMAGHLMLKIFAGFCTMLMAGGVTGMFLTVVPVAFNTALYGLELLVALLQAYIFTILSCIYLKDTVDLHH